MKIGRRQLLGGLVAGAGALALGCAGRRLGARPRELWLSAQGDAEDRYALTIVDAADPGDARDVLTGFRGHDLVSCPADPACVVMFGRRPGRAFLVVDIAAARAVRELAPGAGRSFQGHGCFSADGGLLYAAEADDQTAEGVISLWETATWERVGERPSHGLGPHDLALLPDGQTLVIANGGLLTHPESGAAPVNLDTMRACLAYVDAATGDLVEEATFREPKASIRHLAVARDGLVAVGMQVQRQALDHTEPVALAATHRRGDPLVELSAPPTFWDSWRDYVGSVALSDAARTVAMTSPRGNIAALWDLDTGALIGHHRLNDVCGVTASADGRRIIISNTSGELRLLDAATAKELPAQRRRLSGYRFDNHMITVMV
ncbi:MAG: hypothetical protein CSA66_00075 [Proteobacteria bacterium]|nr:MAG: hypothetical protein CSA66_00075 [Pseudomonadota bacterium]